MVEVNGINETEFFLNEGIFRFALEFLKENMPWLPEDEIHDVIGQIYEETIEEVKWQM